MNFLTSGYELKQDAVATFRNIMEVMKNRTYLCVRTASIIVASMLICIASSCVRRQQTFTPLHPYIAKIVGDTSLVDHHIMTDFHLKRSGAVYVIGKPADCQKVADALCVADYFDNIDASSALDRLADFGGETIVSIEDHALCTSFPAVFDRKSDSSCKALPDSTLNGVSKDCTLSSDGDLSQWREKCLRIVVDALDSLCYANPYTSEKTVAKIPCKILVLASPEFNLAKSDIDTLFSIFNIDLKVISAATELSSFAVSRHGKSASLALLAERPSLYEYALSESETGRKSSKATSSSDDVSSCGGFVFVDSLSTSLPELLSAYHESGEDVAPLDALLVEDDSLATVLNTELNDVLQGEGLDYEIYRSVLSDRFEIVSKEHALSSAAYLSLRKDGLFTHRAAAPVLAKYLMVPELVYPDLSDWRIISYTEKHSCVENEGI